MHLFRGFSRFWKRQPGLQLEERRQRNRIRTELEARCTFLGSEEVQTCGRVRDVGAVGLCVEVTSARVPVGCKVRVSCSPSQVLHGRQRLLCHVVWARPMGDGCVLGLVVCDTSENLAVSWLTAIMKRLGSVVRGRRYVRYRTDMEVNVRVSEGSLSGRVLDLAAGGAQVYLEFPLQPGAVVHIDLGRVRAVGRVVNLRQVDGERGRRYHVRFFAQPGEALVGVLQSNRLAA